MARSAGKMTLEEKANAILKRAEECGVSQDYFFTTTFERYRVQLSILESLRDAIGDQGAMVEKEYVRGSKNLYANPAIKEYNRAAVAANQTVITLMKIVEGFEDEPSGSESKLGKFLQGLEE